MNVYHLENQEEYLKYCSLEMLEKIIQAGGHIRIELTSDSGKVLEQLEINATVNDLKILRVEKLLDRGDNG